MEYWFWTGWIIFFNSFNIAFLIILEMFNFFMVGYYNDGPGVQIKGFLRDKDEKRHFELGPVVFIYCLIFLIMFSAVFCLTFKNKTLRLLVVLLFIFTMIALTMANILTSINTHKMKGSVEKTMQYEIDDLKEDGLMAYLHQKYCCCDIYDTVGGNCSLNFPQTSKCFMGSLNYTTGCLDPMWNDFQPMKSSHDRLTFALIILAIACSVFSILPYCHVFIRN